MRSYTNQFDNGGHTYNAEHTAALRASVIPFVEDPDLLSQGNTPSVTNYSLSVAIAQYVAKATELKQFDLDSIRAGQAAASAAFNGKFVRLMDYMIRNVEGLFGPYLGDSMTWYLGEFDSNIAQVYKTIVVLTVVDPIVILLLMLMFVPFILRIQANLLWVCMHLCKFKGEDVRKWMEACNNAAEELRVSSSEMRAVYCRISFDITINPDPESAEKPAADAIPTVTRLPGDATKDTSVPEGDRTSLFASVAPTTPTNGITQTEDKLLSAESPAEEDKSRLLEINRARENDVSERKQKIFSQMTRKRTWVYLAYLGIFGMYISVFRVADVCAFTQVYYDDLDFKNTFKAFVARELGDLNAEFYFREELVLGQPIVAFGIFRTV